jgi:ribosomal protein S18 acetylase RimI-like enzyme
MAEEEAVSRGCHSAWVDTLNPAALSLYERLGYERFGELKNFPSGGSRTFLRKGLKDGIGGSTHGSCPNRRLRR